MKGLGLIVGGTLVLAVAAILGPAALASEKPKGDDEAPGVSRASLVGVNFIENCKYSHRAPDDPIVFPGKAGGASQARGRLPERARQVRQRLTP